jgi:hypothetical protein
MIILVIHVYGLYMDVKHLLNVLIYLELHIFNVNNIQVNALVMVQHVLHLLHVQIIQIQLVAKLEQMVNVVG